jgi:hypothetical protein
MAYKPLLASCYSADLSVLAVILRVKVLGDLSLHIGFV